MQTSELRLCLPACLLSASCLGLNACCLVHRRSATTAGGGINGRQKQWEGESQQGDYFTVDLNWVDVVKGYVLMAARKFSFNQVPAEYVQQPCRGLGDDRFVQQDN